MIIGITTGINLDLSNTVDENKFYGQVRKERCEALIITGGISEPDKIEYSINRIKKECDIPVYFVLGSRDFHGSSCISEVKRMAEDKLPDSYLESARVIRLSSSLHLIGEDGWYDGKCGNYENSEFENEDFKNIEEFKGRDKASLLPIIQDMAEKSVSRIREKIRESINLGVFHLLIATHVPPFETAAWNHGFRMDENLSPFHVNKLFGDVVTEETEELRKNGGEVTVFCGRSMGEGRIRPERGLFCFTSHFMEKRPSLRYAQEFWVLSHSLLYRALFLRVDVYPQGEYGYDNIFGFDS
jgi:3',5'-cyclic-AMP phosphodiesterase